MSYKNLLEEFVTNRNKLQKSLRAFLTPYSIDDYIKIRAKIWLSSDGKSGFAITSDGELISVFSLVKGRGDEIVKQAIKMGAKRLDCLGDKLKNLYERHGFKVVRVVPFDEKYAPKEWDYAKFGKPPLYIMERNSTS